MGAFSGILLAPSGPAFLISFRNLFLGSSTHSSFGFEGVGICGTGTTRCPASGTTLNPFQYTGRDYDSGTGLRYYRARYYDPQIGRFVSEDPLRFDGGINFYAYVGNDPVRFVDPLGLQIKTPTVPMEAGNCMAHALGVTEWIGPQPFQTEHNPNWPVTWMQQKQWGCKPIGCDVNSNCEKRKKVVVFVDVGKWDNWHVMRQQCNGTWTSKNGAEPAINDIPIPLTFYQNNFHPKGNIKMTCWSCP